MVVRCGHAAQDDKHFSKSASFPIGPMSVYGELQQLLRLFLTGSHIRWNCVTRKESVIYFPTAIHILRYSVHASSYPLFISPTFAKRGSAV